MTFHFPGLHYTLNRELTELYASIALRKFTLGLVSIFVPIYIFLYFSEDITKTLFYFGSLRMMYGLLAPFGGKLITKFGVKHCMLFSTPFLFLYYLGLWQIEALGGLLFLLIPILAIHDLFYWPAFHIDFARFSEEKSRSKQLSYRHTAIALSSAASPLIGGIVLTSFGYPILFTIVIVMLFVSVFPLFLSSEVHERYTDSFGEAYREIFQKKYRNKSIAFFGEGIEIILHIIIWPIFLFTLAISYSSIGLISSVALFAGVIFVLYLGRLIDKIGHARLLPVGAVLNAFTWPIKMFVATPFDAFVVNTLHQFTRLTALMPLATLFYDWTAREDINRDRFVILREVTVNIAMGVILFSLAIIFLFVENMAIAFPIAGAFSLLFMFFTKGSKIEEPTKTKEDLYVEQ